MLLLLKWQGMKRAIRRLQRLVYHSDSDSLPVEERRQEQRQPQPQLPPYKGKTPRRSKEARLPKHSKDLGGGALTLPLDDPRRRNPSNQYGLESHEAIRPNGNEREGGRERLWEWSQQRNTLYKRRDDAEARVAARNNAYSSDDRPPDTGIEWWWWCSSCSISYSSSWICPHSCTYQCTQSFTHWCGKCGSTSYNYSCSHQRSGPQPPPHRPRRPPGYRTPTPPTPESIGEFSQESEGPESYGGGNGEVSSEL